MASLKELVTLSTAAIHAVGTVPSCRYSGFVVTAAVV
jgi:hypothetical protein